MARFLLTSALVKQCDGCSGGGHGHRGSQGWQTGPLQCYQCSTLGHIATHCLETCEDAQCMLQEAQEQGCFKSGTQFLMTGIKDSNKGQDTMWQVIQDHRSVQHCHRNIPTSWILLNSQSTGHNFVKQCLLRSMS